MIKFKVAEKGNHVTKATPSFLKNIEG